MSHIAECPNCSTRYRIADSNRGKRVRCKQCGTVFTVATAATSSPPISLTDISDPLDPLAGADPFESSGASASGPLHGGTTLLGTTAYSAHGQYAPGSPHAKNAGISNPSGGPTDAKMRLGACGMLAFGIVLAIGSLALNAATGTVYIAVLGLVPLMFILGIAGLISPNVVRACGKYGGHLPSHYKFIGWGLMASSLPIMILGFIILFASGYQSDTPRPRRPVRQANSWPQPKERSSIAEATSAQENDRGVQPDPIVAQPTPIVAKPDVNKARPDPNATKPLKSYPVTIPVPSDSQLVPADAKLSPGTRLEACWAGKWNPIAFLSENEDGTLTVRWDDFGAAYDCRMIRKELIVKTDVLD